jgi:hypothetical protein
MARGETLRRDMGPEISGPPCSTGNAGGTKDAWENGSALDKASDAGLEMDDGRQGHGGNSDSY